MLFFGTLPSQRCHIPFQPEVPSSLTPQSIEELSTHMHEESPAVLVSSADSWGLLGKWKLRKGPRHLHSELVSLLSHLPGIPEVFMQTKNLEAPSQVQISLQTLSSFSMPVPYGKWGSLRRHAGRWKWDTCHPTSSLNLRSQGEQRRSGNNRKLVWFWPGSGRVGGRGDEGFSELRNEKGNNRRINTAIKEVRLGATEWFLLFKLSLKLFIWICLIREGLP